MSALDGRIQQVQACPVTVNETVCVQAVITITPDVTVGEINSFCIGAPNFVACTGTPVEECTFTVSQNICVEIPLTFSVEATATPNGVVCGIPATGGCTAA